MALPHIRPKRVPDSAEDSLVFLYSLFQRYEECHPIFCYSGPFAENLTAHILDISEFSMSAVPTQPLINRKVSFLLVECFQNIIKHGKPEESTSIDSSEPGIFTFRNQDNCFTINSINLVLQEDIAQLNQQVESVNSLKGMNLKELYLHQLENSQINNKGGAGLGLIELARKSGNDLICDFSEVDHRFARFHQQVTMLHKKSKVAGSITNKIEDTDWLHAKLIGHGIMLFFKGDLSQKSILSILSMVEQNFGDSKSGGILGRKVGHILIELLQNIAKHTKADSPHSDGIFMLSNENDRIRVMAGNIISSSARSFLDDKLKFLSRLSPAELKNLHLMAIKASLKFENKSKSGLGLIEVAMACQGRMQFKFEERGPDQHFFGLDVII